MKIEDGQTHNMTLKNEKDGTEEWYCPICGRRLLVNWQPKFEKTVLEVGNEYAFHSGGKSGVQARSTKVMSEQHNTFDEDIWLVPWAKWWEEAGFEQLWDNSDI